MRTHCPLLFIVLILSCCENKDIDPVYDEGEVIPGTEVTVSMEEGAYTWDTKPDLNSDGTKIAYSDYFTKSLVILDVKSGEKKILYKNGYSPDWSHNDEWIAFNTYPVIWKIRANGDDIKLLANEGNNFLAAWNSIGSEIAYSRSTTDDFGPGGTWIMDSIGNNKRFVFSLAYPNWFEEDSKILGLRFFDQILTIDNKSGQVINKSSIPFNIETYDLELSHLENLLLYFNDGIRISNTDGKNIKKILPSFMMFKEKKGDQIGFLAKDPTWHPDGKHIIYQHFKITEYWKAESICTICVKYGGVMSLRMLKVAD